MEARMNTSRSNDAWLLALKQPGEAQEEALEELRDYLLRAVLFYLRNHRSDLSDLTGEEIRQFAEDMAQDSLLAVRDHLSQFRGEAKFTTWAYRFAINRTATELRLHHYRTLSIDNLLQEESAVFYELAANPGGADPSLQAERQELIIALRHIIREQLTDRQRLAILGVHFYRRSMDEVADQLGMSRNSLYKLLHDARKKIKNQLETHYFGEGDVLAIFDIDW
jgi:RNA polymerase sigma-70 factor, ECF subfamily